MSAMVVPATSTFQLLFVTEFVERFNQFFDFFPSNTSQQVIPSSRVTILPAPSIAVDAQNTHRIFIIYKPLRTKTKWDSSLHPPSHLLIDAFKSDLVRAFLMPMLDHSRA